MPSKPPFNWPLAISSFNLIDKLRIGWFLLTEDIWTYGKWVKIYENLWVQRFGVKNAVMVSSGSAANELIALRRKWELQQAGQWPQRNKVLFPVNTWISSVSVWINLGFEPVFVDVSEGNLNVTSSTLERTFAKDTDQSISTVFYTALLGFFNDLDACKTVTEQHNARFLMDNCEASFSYSGVNENGLRPLLKVATCSTSIFFSHFTSSGTEGGLIFTDDDEEADWYRMARSHGLTRGMPDRYKNPNVTPEFDFYLLGSNYRSSNLQAYMASLDFERAYCFSLTERRLLFQLFNSHLNFIKYSPILDSDDLSDIAVPLAIPILCHTKEQRLKAETYLRAHGVMVRPIIGGVLLAHTAFKTYGQVDDYPVAKWAHECGLYIGLHRKVTSEMVLDLVSELNVL